MIFRFGVCALAVWGALVCGSDASASVILRVNAGTTFWGGPPTNGAVSNGSFVTTTHTHSLGNPQFPGNGTATAYGDATTGKLGVFATSDPYYTAAARAELDEWLTFHIDGATADTITNIAFSFAHEGVLSRTPYGAADMTTSATSQLTAFVGQTYSATHGYLPAGSFSSSARLDQHGLQTTLTHSNWASSDLPDELGDAGVFVYSLRGANPTIQFRMSLTGSSYANAEADFSQTATVRLQTPTNVTWTSQSGLFLTDVAAAVPEPSSWALVILGFGSAGAMLRSRRRQAPA